MQSFTRRAGRWPLALTIVALAAVTACADDPAAPKVSTTPTRTLIPDDPGDPDGHIEVTVTNPSGGTEVGSIRWAAAQIPPDGGTIRFDPSVAGDTIALDSTLYLPHLTYISAPDDKGITLSGKDQHRVVEAASSVGFRNVTITKGNAPSGSAILAPQLSLEFSTVQGNRSDRTAVYATGAGLALYNSTVSGNTVGTAAVRYKYGASVVLDNSTIAYNAPGPGLAMEISSNPNLSDVRIRNSILAHNGNPLRNCNTYVGFFYAGTNIVSDWSCGEVGMIVTDPQLFPLARNGGPTMTHAIPHTSPAYNSGTACLQAQDQRHVTRDARCDVGAFEFNDFTKATITIDQNTRVDAATGRATLTGTIKCTRNDSFRLALELHQDQRVGKEIVDVHSASDIPMSCTTAAKPWSATMGLLPGEAWQAGAARATAVTFQTPQWMTPANVASGVKISFPRK